MTEAGGNRIAAALLGAQQEIGPIAKNARGHNNRYADLGAVTDAIVPALNRHGVVVLQVLDHVAGQPALRTELIHAESGEQIAGTFPLEKAGLKGANDGQQMGAGISYARRYALLSLMCVPTADDDAQSLTPPAPVPPPPAAISPPTPPAPGTAGWAPPPIPTGRA